MTINFLAALQQEAQNIEKKSAGRDRDEAPRTKNPILRLGGKNKVTELKLRILPSVQMINGEPGALLGVQQRSIFFDVKAPNKTYQNSAIVLPPIYDATNEVEQKIAEWTNDNYINRVGTQQFGPANPRTTYWLNVLMLVKDATGEYTYELDADGQPKVYAFSIARGGYNQITKLAADSDYFINGQPFVAFDESFPMAISKPSQQEFSVNVMANKKLAPIDINAILPKMDDFKEIVKPISETQNSWWETVKFYMEAAEKEALEAPVASQAPELNLADPFAVPAQAPAQGGITNGVTSPFTNVAPQQATPNPFQPQAPVQQAPVQQAPVQQAPVQQAPVQQAPVQQAPVQQAPVANVTEPATLAGMPTESDIDSLMDGILNS